MRIEQRDPNDLKQTDAVQTGPTSDRSLTMRLEQDAETERGRWRGFPG